MLNRLLAIVFVIFALATTAYAGMTPREVPEELQVTTPARIVEMEGMTTSFVTVIRRPEIELMGAVFVDDLLRRIGVLTTLRQGGQGGPLQTYIRGVRAEQTVVLIDGVRVGSAIDGYMDLSGLMVEDIERIEIARGPHSVAYGNHADGGVINIITRKGTGPLSIDLSYAMGANNTMTPGVTVSGGGDSMRFRISAAYNETDGVSSAANGDPDGHELLTYSGYFSMPFSGTGLIEVMAMRNEMESSLDRVPAPGLTAEDIDLTQDRDRELMYAKMTYYSSRTLMHTLTASEWTESVLREDPTYAMYNTTTSSYDYTDVYRLDAETTFRALEYQGHVYEGGNSVGMYGAEVKQESAMVNGTAGEYEDEVEIMAAYLNLKMEDGPYTFIFGGRQIEHEIYEDWTVYRVSALQVDRGESIKYRAGYATGISFPSVAEIHANGDNLKPSESKAWEVGFEKGMDESSSFSLVYFHQDLYDIIEVDPVSGLPENRAEGDIKGAELSYSAKSSDSIGYTLSYTWLEAKDGLTGEPLPLRPEDRIDLKIMYGSSSLGLQIDGTYMGARPDPLLGADLAPYNVVNLGLSYKLGDMFMLYGRADNVLKEEYVDMSGLSMAEREYYFGLRARF